MKLNAVEQIAGQIEPHGDFDVQLEATLSLMNILTDNQQATFRCRESGLNLQTKLKDIIRLCDDKPECLEIVEFSHSLMDKLFVTTTQDVQAER